MNKLTLVGNVVNEPVLRTVNTAQGLTKVVDFRFAADNLRTKKTVYVKATAWRGAAETIAQYVHAKQKLYLAGPVDAEAYIDKQTGQARAQLVMQIEDFEFAGNARAESAPAQRAVYEPRYDNAPVTEYEEYEEEDSGLPF